MQQHIATIKHIIELALGHSVNMRDSANCLIFTVENIDELALIKHYLNHPSLITKELIDNLVATHLAMFPVQKISNTPATRWDQYLLKLETALEQVKHRAASNYALEQIMPTQYELEQWQQECMDLTEQWYGAGKGNLSCFYKYFIAMSQAAGITYFKYMQIGKFISKDLYISAINKDQRKQYFWQHEQTKKDYIAQGGYQAHGKSLIDATAISNTLYYKHAQLNIFHEFAKEWVVAELGLENYGQLPYAKRVTLWHLLQQHFPSSTPEDQNSIFYKFAEFVNYRPGEFFNHFASDLPEVNNVSQETFHNIVKIVGMQTKRLFLLPRTLVDNWVAKRHLVLKWQRQFPLNLIDKHGDTVTIRAKHSYEYGRIQPNELPYAIAHGLSLCGNGLREEPSKHDAAAFEWNNPVDTTCNIDNWPRDIEKIFKEFKFFYPRIDIKNQLFGESPCNIFHNGMAYSTIHATQHTHISVASVDEYLVYMLPAIATYELGTLNASCDIVQVGDDIDSIYLRFIFNDIDNTSLLELLIKFNEAIFMHFGGCMNFDVHLHLFINNAGKLVFIYEPHVLLIQLDHDTFKNPVTDAISNRKPQFFQPVSDHIEFFTDNRANGLDYCRKLFDATVRPGIKQFIVEFLDRHAQSPQ